MVETGWREGKVALAGQTEGLTYVTNSQIEKLLVWLLQGVETLPSHQSKKHKKDDVRFRGSKRQNAMETAGGIALDNKISEARSPMDTQLTEIM